MSQYKCIRWVLYKGGYGHSVTITCNPKDVIHLGDFVTVYYEDSYIGGSYRPCIVKVML